ncbi:MAG TPA: hypothetical protein VF171_07675 [Trueperaceae bacterium]
MGSFILGVVALWLAWLGVGLAPVPSTLMTMMALAVAALVVLRELDRIS